MSRSAVALVGFGHWGRVLARKLNAHPQLTLALICELSPHARAEARLRYPHALITDELEALASPHLELVVIATPPSTHLTLASQLLRLKKHLWLEKPCGVSAEELSELTSLAERERCALHLGYLYAYHPLMEQLLERAPKLSRAQGLRVKSWRHNEGRRGASAGRALDLIYDLGVHDLSALKRLVPQLNAHALELQLDVLERDPSDGAPSRLSLSLSADGLEARLEVSWWGAPKRRALWVEADEVRLSLELEGLGNLKGGVKGGATREVLTARTLEREVELWRAPAPPLDPLDRSLHEYITQARALSQGHARPPLAFEVWELGRFCHEVIERLGFEP